MANGKKMIIFDWNGTLIDDVWLNLNAINSVLEKRRMHPITIEYYRENFCFPVSIFYKELGLDIKNEWEEIAQEFGKTYISDIDKVKLFPDVVSTLEELTKAGIEVSILSAMEHKMLNKHVEMLRINNYFRFIEGIENYYAEGKTHLCREILEKSGYSEKEILFVGDTCHDYETAKTAGCDVALVSRGHNTEEILKNTGAPVFKSLTDLLKRLI
ncbi:HAD family hydrolase [bacterium]|nr:HAD family hydrolase [bacterium]